MDSEMNLDLDAIEARAKAATPGPWVVDKDAFGIGVIAESQIGIPDNDPEGVYIADCYKKSAEVHAEFIAHAREDIPALIAEVRRLEGELHVDPENEIGRLNAQLETEILRRDSLGETLDNVVADHKRDIARLADIKAKAVSALSKANPENEKWRCPEFAALAAALEGDV